MSHTIRLLTLIIFFSALAVAQTTSEKKTAEDREKVEKEAVAFLRETLGDVNGMRSLENRISFTAELAGLMWFHDEREARAMYAGVIADFRELLAGYDSQMNSFVQAPDEETEDRGNYSSLFLEQSDKSRLQRRFITAMGVRNQIAATMAEHDPDLAFGFYYDSLAAVTNPALREKVDAFGTYFEFGLLNKVAGENAAKAAKYGVRSLAKGVRSEHIELLKKIYAKDADKGIEFGSAVLSRLKAGKPPGKPSVKVVDEYNDLFVSSALLNFGSETYEASRKPGGKRAVYSNSELREIAEVLAGEILARSEDDGFSPLSYADTVQKYLPGRAAQIRTKFKLSPNAVRNASSNSSYTVSGGSNAMANSAYAYGDSANSNSNTSRTRQEREKAEQKLAEDVSSLGTKQLSKEEREKIIAQSRKVIMQTPGRDKKIISLSMLAAQVSKAGDKELATEIMRDAERLVNPAPKNYQDFMLTWMLASGYANADPEKSFPILEETISRANDTLAAFIKVGEFIDVNEDMIQDGEVQVGAFGGGMVRGLTSELNMADTTIQVLARSDFAKTKGLTNRFERPEIRILAKMMVLRAVLNPKGPAKPEDTVESTTEPVEN